MCSTSLVSKVLHTISGAVLKNGILSVVAMHIQQIMRFWEFFDEHNYAPDAAEFDAKDRTNFDICDNEKPSTYAAFFHDVPYAGGTFKVSPELFDQGNTYNLFTIPVARYVIPTSMYVKMLNALKELALSLNSVSITSDYEKVAKNAFKSVFSIFLVFNPD
ncbi:hypothetical protein Ocin01_19539 [Orchesella cincta]|uniref:Uncharacterized protein n=1 Tax=Orchesella cincta TaxID=48709 RepID=A0A1D2M2H6_ORCCI|nr:hypothetical protein Ocin01_19539 [Orchesella cincta]